MGFAQTNLVLGGAYALFSILLLVAAATDIWRYVIPNWVSLALVGLFAALGVTLAPPTADWWLLHLGAGVVVLAAGFFAYALRLIGAGDVKLLAAVALFAGFGQLHTLLLYVVLAGGVLASILLALRWLIAASGLPSRTTVSLPKVLMPKENVPYGVAIAAGAMLLGYDLMPGLVLVT